MGHRTWVQLASQETRVFPPKHNGHPPLFCTTVTNIIGSAAATPARVLFACRRLDVLSLCLSSDALEQLAQLAQTLHLRPCGILLGMGRVSFGVRIGEGRMEDEEIAAIERRGKKRHGHSRVHSIERFLSWFRICVKIREGSTHVEEKGNKKTK